MGKANFTEDFKRDAVVQITERGYPVVEVAAPLGISKYSLYEWKKRYGKPAAVARDDDQAAEVRRLKRELVGMMCGEWQVSSRRACAAQEFDRSTHHYKSCRPDQAGLAARIKAICETRVRYGYRRVQVLLRREGWVINQKRTRWIYNELGLQLRNKTPKRRVKAKLREDRAPATRPNDAWAMDFVHDQLATGRKIRVLSVVATLERVCAKVGYPRTIRVDQGSEFVSRDLDLWAYAKGGTLDFSRPGKPTDNAFIEAFNGRFRSECLNTHWFLTLADAAEKMEAWLRYYNEDRPHGAIGHKPPITLQNSGGAPSPPP